MRNTNVVIRTVEDGLGKIGVIFDGGVNIYIPKYYIIDQEKEIKQFTSIERQKLKNLAKAWQKYQRTNKYINSCQSNCMEGFYDFDTSLKLIRDFIEVGLYSEYEKKDQTCKSGKIEFAKTLKKCRPLYTEQGAIYLSYISETKKHNDENIIRNVQILILNEISMKIGWMVGFNVSLPTEYITFNLSKSLINQLIFVRNTSYNTRKVRLIGLLIAYLEMNTGGKGLSSELFVGTAYNFWESMIADVFGNVMKKEMQLMFYVRHAFIKKMDINYIRNLDPLMPDAVYKNDKSIILLDAKYYTNNNKPTNDDITKQFAYMSKAYNYFMEGYEYRNIFVLPTDGISCFSDELVVFDRDIAPSKEYVEIELLYINFEEVLLKYIHNRSVPWPEPK